MKRKDILERASKLISDDRDKEYGSAQENFQRIADIWTAIKGEQFTASDVGLFMIAVKLARLSTNPKHIDSYLDIAGYAALTGELE
jgi:2-oxo-4-hydroxy-4-carboxy--5-ureidoimidazoline (OHCU) decarboxylase